MLKLADVGPEDVVYDLGCGDGRILFSAIKEFRAKKAVGYELRRDLYKAAVKNVERQNLQKRITIFNDNLFKADISEADVITLYLTTSGNERLKPKLVKEAQLGTYIIPNAFNSPTKRRLVKKHSFLDRLFENPFL
jgi:tRNA A58 N-methylase Trm61